MPSPARWVTATVHNIPYYRPRYKLLKGFKLYVSMKYKNLKTYTER